MVRITGFLDFVHHPIFQKQDNAPFQSFRSRISFHPQVKGETPTLLGLLERANLNHYTTYVKRKNPPWS
jgi:hypothetical protein